MEPIANRAPYPLAPASQLACYDLWPKVSVTLRYVLTFPGAPKPGETCALAEPILAEEQRDGPEGLGTRPARAVRASGFELARLRSS